MESTSKKWLNNGFRKWRGKVRHQAPDAVPVQSYHISRDINDCYEGSKNCLDSCSDKSYNKQRYGWVGFVQRQLQRSQYQIQYGWPIQFTVWVILAIFLIGSGGNCRSSSSQRNTKTKGIIDQWKQKIFDNAGLMGFSGALIGPWI